MQVGITLVSVLTGVFGGARIAVAPAGLARDIPSLAPVRRRASRWRVVVIVTTYLTLVLGELVPKQLALRRPELMAARVARPIAVLSRVVGPVVWLLGKSSGADPAAVRRCTARRARR